MPANPLKGERSVEINGRAYRLVYSFTAMALIEEHTGQPFGAFLQAISDGLPWSDVPRVFWWGLQQHQPDLTLADATQLAGELGVMETVTAVAEAFGGAFPIASGEAGAATSDPPAPDAGSGAS